MDQRRGEVETALHPARVGVDLPVDGRSDVDQGEHLDHPGQPFVTAQPVEPGLQVEQFPTGLPVVEGGVLQSHPDLQPDELGLAGHVVAGHEALSPRGPEQRAEHPDEC